MPFTPSLRPRPDLLERRWYVVHPAGLVVRREGESIVLPSDEDVGRLGIDVGAAHPLGYFDDAQALAVDYAGVVAAPFEACNARALASLMDAESFHVAGRAIHVMDWATTSKFCGRCGERTAPVVDERCMKCASCGLTAYPRIAPAIIVLVRRDDRALLARNGRFPGGMFSTLAGFAEIGESLEQTLAREVHEEVGVRVDGIRYVGSQPWPFPHSLMIGFTARWTGGEIVVDGSEITEARWFSADELPRLPPPQSIARRLIDTWVTEVRGR